MALLSAGQLTLADVSKRTSPDGMTMPIAELLSQSNEILEDAVYVEANQMTHHVVSVRTGLPTAYWVAYNMGVPPGKSTTAQVNEPMAMLKARSQIDESLLKLNGNSKEVRLSEDSAFIEAMGIELAEKIFNGNVGVDQKAFSGLATRYSSTTAGNGQNVMLAGGVGSDNASMYLIGWSPETVFMTYPKGSQAGLMSEDLGVESVPDGSGNFYRAAVSLFSWTTGLCVKDWRYAVRIANIDVSDFIGVTGTQATTAATNLLNLMTRAIARIPAMANARFAFYANRSICEGLMVQALARSNNALSVQESITQFGNRINTLKFLGIPVRIVDKLGIAETLVS